MRKKRDPRLDPLPKWRQHLNRARAGWRRRWAESKDRRQAAYSSLKKAGRRGLTLAISVVGGTLVAYGVWDAYAPAGYVVGGLLLWAIQWNYGEGGKG